MKESLTLTATDGTPIEIYREIAYSGCCKDIYMSVDGKFVLAMYKNSSHKKAEYKHMEIVCSFYRDRIRNSEDSAYWEELFVWPRHIVIWHGRLGVISPVYPKHFYFESGKFMGKEKEGTWFASAKLRNKYLEPEFRGDMKKYIEILTHIVRGMKLLHESGFLYADFDPKKLLADPVTGKACLLYNTSILAPGEYTADIWPTPGFLAPEAVMAMERHCKIAPPVEQNYHSLAVLIYMFLFCRHPLLGAKVHDRDPEKDEYLTFGERALFVEHPTDSSNRVDPRQLSPYDWPQGDPARTPYTLSGPYLKPLFDRAFIDGLHNPALRPTCDEWLAALQKTLRDATFDDFIN